MCVGYFLVLLDVTIVNVALPHIRTALGAGVSGIQWVVDGYAIVLASTMLAAGTLGDIRGHRRIVLGGLALFGVASLGCALAPGTAALVAARAVQGLGAAMLLPGTLAIIADTYPGDEQARAIGVWAAVGSIALPAGPLLGGALVQALGWRSVFFVNVPIVIATLVVAARVAPDAGGTPGRRLDLAGTVFGGAFLALVTFAFIDAGRSGFGSMDVLGALAAAACLIAFVRAERRSADPMLPLGLFRRKRFRVANAAAGTMNLCTLGMLFVLTLYLQDVRAASPLTAGLELLPLFVPLVLIAPLAGRFAARVGPGLPMAIGLVVGAIGLALLTALTLHSGYATLLPALLLWGGGMAVLTPAVVAAAIAAVPRERGGLASAVNNTARQAGGAIGIAAFGALAGTPAARATFMTGLHRGAVISAVLWLSAAVRVALTFVKGRQRCNTSTPSTSQPHPTPSTPRSRT
jgi:DHA2 family methylenomycin A resistance protein-like MFS transporter